MNIRRTVSLTAALAFMVMVLTSVILYIVPQGRVAYWADWRLMGLSKNQWGAVHINMGLLFLIALGLHVYYNWRPLTQYLKDRARNCKVFTSEFNLAAVLVVVFTLGTLAGWAPFGTILDIQDDIKAAAARKYGEPPYGHAELSTLGTFTRKTGLDLQAARTALVAAGYQIAGPEQSLQAMAAANGVSPQTLYNAMAPAAASKGDASRPLPEKPPPGTGKLTLDDFGRQYGLDAKHLRGALEANGIKVGEGMTIKAIAAANGRSPVDVYDMLRTAASSSPASG
ncbi:MAG: DUF4405 domain-containing protein [Desulfobacterales bacterium]|nr:DUF4405 domain-containing protein [Desulfobacterales bacterium]